MEDKQLIYEFGDILKPTLWGGGRIAPFKGIAGGHQGIGESWELSGVPGSESVVKGGPMDGTPLPSLVDKLGAWLLGERNYRRFGTRFPLLIKFIDARQDLSIQVHPDDALAQARHGSPGKTEMWYVVDAAPGARLRSGFSRSVTPGEYTASVADDTVTDLLSEYDVKAGDVFFLPAGRIHSIGAGCFIAEIQQTSDITYRIYDFNRRDKDGNTRELHTSLAVDAIDYSVLPDYRTLYEPRTNAQVHLASCPYFTTHLYDIDRPCTIDRSHIDSFMVLMGLDGEATVKVHGQEARLRRGHTMLIAAAAQCVEVVPLTPATKFLTAYVD